MDRNEPIKPVHPPRTDPFPKKREQKDRASTPERPAGRPAERPPEQPLRQDPQFDPSNINED